MCIYTYVCIDAFTCIVCDGIKYLFSVYHRLMKESVLSIRPSHKSLRFGAGGLFACMRIVACKAVKDKQVRKDLLPQM